MWLYEEDEVAAIEWRVDDALKLQKSIKNLGVEEGSTHKKNEVLVNVKVANTINIYI